MYPLCRGGDPLSQGGQEIRQQTRGGLWPTGSVSLVFDDRFHLTQINRAETDTFDVLSVGTREQIGVVVRLAMASVLAADGPLTVILDDALVATDETRFLRMIPVLSDAAQRLQILMLTCHWSRYQAVGKVADRVIDLEVLKRGG